MTEKSSNQPDIQVPLELAEVIKAGVRAGREVPGSVALGGAVCALFARHRASVDIDFVLADLKHQDRRMVANGDRLTF